MKTYRQENAMDETELPKLDKLFVDCNKDQNDLESPIDSSKMPNNHLCRANKENYRQD